MPNENNIIHLNQELHTVHMPDSTVVNRIELMDEYPEVIRDTPFDKPIAQDMSKALVVNLFAGPGAGKSTMAAGIFFELKSRGINCELAAEYAKDLCWEERTRTFDDQIYIFGKQYHRIFRLLRQVAVVITDSPLLLTPIYDAEKRPTLEKLVLEEHNKMWTYNVFLNRKKAFNPAGRNHDVEQSKKLDCAVANMLLKHDILFETFEGTPEGKNAIVKKILLLLKPHIDLKINDDLT